MSASFVAVARKPSVLRDSDDVHDRGVEQQHERADADHEQRPPYEASESPSLGDAGAAVTLPGCGSSSL
jgi:hypothetical protein